MTEYKIVHREHLVDEFIVEADSPDAAMEEYMRQVESGEINFDRIEMYDSSDEVIKC